MKTKVLSGLVWKFGERISAQVITFFVSIVLARLLEPSHYGEIAIINIFIIIANVFVDSGFGNSLVQKKNADKLDFSSVFYFNIVMSVILYIILFVTAPLISGFYKMPELTPVVRVLSLRLIVAGVNSVQHAYVSRKMMFKRFFWSTLGGTIVSAIVGIIMAYRGYGVWALVAQYMCNTSIDTIVLWFTVKWRPTLEFSIERLKNLFSYGWKLLVSSLIDTGYNQMRGLIIGKMYTPKDLAFYTKGQGFPQLVVSNVSTSIQTVLFPAMSSCQDKKEMVKSMMRRSIKISGFVMFPMMLGLGIVSKPLISLLLTDKWIECVPYLQIFCVTYAFMPIQTANLQAIKAMGRSDLFLKLEIAKKIIGLLTLLISMRFGVYIMALSTIFTTLASSVINAFPNKKLLGYSYFEQIIDLFNSFIPLIVMAIVLILISFIKFSAIYLLIIQIAFGAIIYIAISYLLKLDSYVFIVSTIKNIIRRK